MRLAVTFLAAATIAISVAPAQMQDNRDKKMTCENGGSGDRARYCEIREQSFAGTGRLSVDAGRNGGATVKGWLQNDVLVRARVEAWGDTNSEASSLAGQVHVETAGAQVTATGPESPNQSGWSVSYEIFVPQNTNLNLKTHNGGITISDVRGQIEFSATNGGVHLNRLAGEVSGTTVNGGLQIVLAGNNWEGRQLEVSTRNGGVNLSMPESYSAHIRTETVNGGIQSDFPVTVHGNLRPRNLEFDLGSGGPLIHVSTRNGGVRLHRL